MPGKYAYLKENASKRTATGLRKKKGWEIDGRSQKTNKKSKITSGQALATGSKIVKAKAKAHMVEEDEEEALEFPDSDEEDCGDKDEDEEE